MNILSLVLALFTHTAFAQSHGILANLEQLDKAGAVTIAREESIGLGYALVTPEQEEKISALMHADGKCAGFELVNFPAADLAATARNELRKLAVRQAAEAKVSKFDSLVTVNPALQAAADELSAANIQASVTWLSSFPNRYNRDPNPNVAVNALADRIRSMLQGSQVSWSLDLIDHRSTAQKSIRVRIPGKSRPSEIIVLGGHLDSINMNGGNAPGADDNASGTSSLIEALRVFVTKGQPERTVEFFWYAGEESGLLGSAEIARQYKAEQKDVVAVLQLDMTLFPGEGKFKIMNTTDYTSAWLQSYLKSLNDAYLKLTIVDDQCGYACSDHASWYRQGYPSIFPFESPFESYNHNIHTARDVIDQGSDFEHALQFSKIALLMAMDLGNSTLRQP
jgi:leucyl aminopeptidase